MISDFEVKRRAVAIDVALIESVGRRDLPRAFRIDALEHSVKGVTFGIDGLYIGALALAIGSFEKIGDMVCQLAVHCHVPRLDAIVAEGIIPIGIVYRRRDERVARRHSIVGIAAVIGVVIVLVFAHYLICYLAADRFWIVAAVIV